MITIPMLIREGCPHLDQQVGKMIRATVAVEAPAAASEGATDEERAAATRARRAAVRTALAAVDNLRQGHLSATVAVDQGGDEIAIQPIGHPTVAFDLPGRQTKAVKRQFAQALIAGACNGYLEIQPAELGDGDA